MPGLGTQFKKGHPGTKPKGAISAKTRAWEELGKFIVEEGAVRYMNSLRALEDDKFVERFEHVLEYFKPKLARTEHTDKDGESLQPILVKFIDGGKPNSDTTGVQEAV